MTAEEVAAMDMNKGPDGDGNDKENVQTPVKVNHGSTNSASKRKTAPGQLKATPAKKAKTGAPARNSTSDEDDDEEDDVEDDG